MLILFKHSPQRGLGKGIYLLILVSTLLTDYVSSLLFQIVLLSTKWRAYFISIYDYLYVMSHVYLRSKFYPCSIKFLAPPLKKQSYKIWLTMMMLKHVADLIKKQVLDVPFILNWEIYQQFPSCVKDWWKQRNIFHLIIRWFIVWFVDINSYYSTATSYRSFSSIHEDC